jgi:hypothetical protein
VIWCIISMQEWRAGVELYRTEREPTWWKALGEMVVQQLRMPKLASVSLQRLSS